MTGRVKIVQPMKRKKGDRKHFKNRMIETGSQGEGLKADNHRNSMIDLSALNVSQEELNSIIEKHSQTSLKIELRKEIKTEAAS